MVQCVKERRFAEGRRAGGNDEGLAIPIFERGEGEGVGDDALEMAHVRHAGFDLVPQNRVFCRQEHRGLHGFSFRYPARYSSFRRRIETWNAPVCFGRCCSMSHLPMGRPRESKMCTWSGG